MTHAPSKMKSETTLRIAGLLLVGCGACNAVLGLDERPARGDVDPSGSGGGTAGNGGEAPTSCESVCDGDVPTGWDGPSRILTSDATPLCNEGSLELTAVADPVAPSAQCACACGPAEGIQCDASPITVSTYGDDNCPGSPTASGSGALNACIVLGGGQFSGRYTAPVPDIASASCPPMVVDDTVPPLLWAQHLAGCGPVTTSPCTGGNCFDVSAGDRLCIHRSGDQSCPAGPFSERELWYRDADDSRACETCGCETVVADCNEVVHGYEANNCGPFSAVLQREPGCANGDPDFDSVRIISVAPTGTCTPTPGTATGEVTPTDPVTVCCVP